MPIVENVTFQALETQITGDNGQVFSRIAWSAEGVTQEIETSFQVYRSRYLDEAWGIERTSLIDELRWIY